MNKQLMLEDKNKMMKVLQCIQKNIEKCNFKKVANEFTNGIFITDRDGKILYVNKAYLNMTGLTSMLRT